MIVIAKIFITYVFVKNLGLSLGKLNYSPKEVSFSLGNLGSSHKKIHFFLAKYFSPRNFFYSMKNLLGIGI
jgi:hypothetical protein